MILVGKIKEYDSKFKRIKLEFLENDEKDSYNVHKILNCKDEEYAKTSNLQIKEFWSPNYKSMFICKLDSKVFCYDQFKTRVKDFSEIVGQKVKLEVTLMNFTNTCKEEDERFGWFIKVLSIQVF